jgi:hypothetical protein
MEQQYDKLGCPATNNIAMPVAPDIRAAWAAPKVRRTSVIAAMLLAALPAGAANDDFHHGSPSALEQIYVLRSVREERVSDPNFCSAARIGFTSFNVADRFSLWSVRPRAADGRIKNAMVREAGHFRACFGPTADPRVANFYGEGQIGGTEFTGSGECKLVHDNFPEAGLRTFGCFLALNQLPAPYIGGFLTTNTIVSRAVLGGETDPPGYVQTSIATIRLWRQ